MDKKSEEIKMKDWHKPFMQSMSQSEVDNAVVLNACSNHSCLARLTRII